MRTSRTTIIALLMFMLGGLASAQELGRTAVVVTIQNVAPTGGTHQSPVWVGFHDGSFDLFDARSTADSLPMPGSDALERLAEDGNTASLEAAFATLAGGGLQSVLAANGMVPPLAPGQMVSRIFEIDPLDPNTRYFSFATMVLPSNDTFAANDLPTAHPIYDDRGNFIAEGFFVGGPGAVQDAGTEINDELADNTAFFGQTVANTGDAENGVVHPAVGFNPVGSGGILDDPQFARANYSADRYNLLAVRFHRINLDGLPTFRGRINPMQEIPAPIIERRSPGGKIRLELRQGGDELAFRITTRSLSGPIMGAHLHLAPAGQNGPVVVDLLALQDPTRRNFVGVVRTDDVVGPLGDLERPLAALLAELASGAVYVNLHTELNPSGEIRGQLFRGPRGIVRIQATGNLGDVPLLPEGRTPRTLQGR